MGSKKSEKSFRLLKEQSRSNQTNSADLIFFSLAMAYHKFYFYVENNKSNLVVLAQRMPFHQIYVLRSLRTCCPILLEAN